MKNVLKPEESGHIAGKLKKQGKTIVIAGGCFDIIHVGHIKFLNNAKKEGDVLFLLLENDRNVKRLKGKNRPINSQKDRAEVLSALKSVDFVVLLPDMKSDKDYDKLISQIKPDVIATTAQDPGLEHKKRQAEMIKGKTKEVMRRITDKSTTNLNIMIEESK